MMDLRIRRGEFILAVDRVEEKTRRKIASFGGGKHVHGNVYTLYLYMRTMWVRRISIYT